jgi:hypothetical protein
MQLRPESPACPHAEMHAAAAVSPPPGASQPSSSEAVPARPHAKKETKEKKQPAAAVNAPAADSGEGLFSRAQLRVRRPLPEVLCAIEIGDCMDTQAAVCMLPGGQSPHSGRHQLG